MKVCLQCGNEIPNHKKFCDSSCAATFNNKHRVRTLESRAKTAQSVRRFYKENPEVVAKYRKRMLKTVQSEANRKKISASLKRFWRENPRGRKYTVEQQVYINREAVARAKAKKLGLLPEDADIEAIKKFYLNTTSLEHSVDHIVPLCKGGKHELSNLQYLTIEENCYIKNNK